VIDAPRLEGRLEGDTLHLTEAEVIRMALVNNLDINVERHASLSRAWDVALNKAFYDPKTNFGFNWDRQVNPTTSILQGGPSVTDIMTSYNLGYQQAFSTGTSFEISFLGNRNRTTNFFTSLIPAIRTEFSVLLRQDLLRGFGKADAEYEIEISRNNQDITAEEFRERVTDIIVQAQDRYWELDYAVNDLEVRKKALEYAETVLDQNQARFEVGTASRLEVVEAEAEVAARREELIRAQFTYRRVQDALVQMISDFEDPWRFKGQIVPVVDIDVSDLPEEPFERLMELAGELRPEIQREDLNIANYMVSLERSRNHLRPTLQLVAGYQWFGLGGNNIVRDYSGDNFFDAPIIDIIPGGFGDAMSQMLGGSFGGYIVGLNLQLPIKNVESRAVNAKAQIDLRRAEMNKQAVRQKVGLEVRDALTQVQMNKARLEASQATVRAEAERLQGEEARFEVGMGTTRLLIEAQRDLLTAKSVEVRARTELIKSHALLDKAVGRTFREHNIRLNDALETNVKDPTAQN
jgi:outer membrane protein TolC